ncbi:hypothetical protein TIFTF001_007010 [Ficus carica]|uniref:Uncharacterized protein n=1 Tax=Ficus carica TaxID=3494 RepID=A0AA88CWL2_FICCA|nr:hypothetical protein TIFTF001_007010 [Ficus carica]
MKTQPSSEASDRDCRCWLKTPPLSARSPKIESSDEMAAARDRQDRYWRSLRTSLEIAETIIMGDCEYYKVQISAKIEMAVVRLRGQDHRRSLICDANSSRTNLVAEKDGERKSE